MQKAMMIAALGLATVGSAQAGMFIDNFSTINALTFAGTTTTVVPLQANGNNRIRRALLRNQELRPRNNWVLTMDPQVTMFGPAAFAFTGNGGGTGTLSSFSRVAADSATLPNQVAPAFMKGDTVIIQPVTDVNGEATAATANAQCAGNNNAIIPNFPLPLLGSTSNLLSQNQRLTYPKYCLLQSSQIAAKVFFKATEGAVASPRLKLFRDVVEGRNFMGPVSPEDFAHHGL